jgi:hypothetical protein
LTANSQLDHRIGRDEARMIRIGITQAALDAIAATMPVGSVDCEAQRTEKGSA